MQNTYTFAVAFTRKSLFFILMAANLKNHIDMAETTYSFDAMPKIRADIVNKLEVVERKFDSLQSTPKVETDAWLSLKDFCKYLLNHPVEQTVYGWTSTHFIPFHKEGESIVFLKSEIEKWLFNSKQKSVGGFRKRRCRLL